MEENCCAAKSVNENSLNGSPIHKSIESTIANELVIDNIKRHPSQLYEAFFEGILLFLILRYFFEKKFLKKPGQISGLFLILYSIFRFILEFFRSPDPQIGYLIFDLTFGQLISLVFLIIGIFLFLKKKNEN